MALHLRHVELRDANAFVEQHHRHHKPVRGHRFSLACMSSGILVGVAIIGRPVARGCNFSTTVEITRLATDGTRNACSFLYGACARAAKALGYTKIQTYILDSEHGASLKAAGYTQEATTKGGQWTHTDGNTRRTDQPTCQKTRWARLLT